MKKFNENTGLRELLDTAITLGIKPFGKPKAQLAKEVNAEIEKRISAAEKANTLNIDLDDAMEVLTETEFSIFKTLVDKVEAYKNESGCICGMCDLDGENPITSMLEDIIMSGQIPTPRMFANLILNGKPGTGKNETMEEIIKQKEAEGYTVIRVGKVEEEVDLLGLIGKLKEKGFTDSNVSSIMNASFAAEVPFTKMLEVALETGEKNPIALANSIKMKK